MKKTLFLIFLACNILQMRAQRAEKKDFYDLKSNSIDTIIIKISSFPYKYGISFSIDKNKMRCHFYSIFTKQKIEYELGPDSVETYSFLKDYFIEHKKEMYTVKRKIKHYYTMCESGIDVTIFVDIKNNYFIYAFKLGDTKTDGEELVHDKFLIYSEQFKHFINSWEEKAVNALGGEILEQYNSRRYN